MQVRAAAADALMMLLAEDQSMYASSPRTDKQKYDIKVDVTDVYLVRMCVHAM